MLFGLLVAFALGGCETDPFVINESNYTLEVPPGFPSMEIPEDNQPSQRRITLGKMLFFDKALSVDSSVSCGSCHFPQLAFSDDKALSLGVNSIPGIRNAPSLGNIGYQKSFFRDGGVPTLEQQVLAPISDPNEMAFSVPGVVERMQQNPVYVNFSMKAYGRQPDPFVLTRAIAAFERTLITGNSDFDKHYYQGVRNVLSDSEKRGLQLFMSSRTNCSTCHSGFNFTDLSFRNNGLYEVYTDTGRKRITTFDEDYGKFKVASLRNVELTGPYMHDGSLNTLEEVVEHYNAGGQTNLYKDPLIRSLNLTLQEKEDIVNFLSTLTDQSFLTNPAFFPQ